MLDSAPEGPGTLTPSSRLSWQPFYCFQSRSYQHGFYCSSDTSHGKLVTDKKKKVLAITFFPPDLLKCQGKNKKEPDCWRRLLELWISPFFCCTFIPAQASWVSTYCRAPGQWRELAHEFEKCHDEMSLRIRKMLAIFHHSQQNQIREKLNGTELNCSLWKWNYPYCAHLECAKPHPINHHN